MDRDPAEAEASDMFRLNRAPRSELVPTFPPGSTIPKIIHQTYHAPPLPDALQANIAHLRAMNPGWEHRFHDYEDRRAFIDEVYGRAVLDLYDAIDARYGAARADLFRYLLLYRVGGVYLDMKSSTGRPLDEVIRPTDLYLLSTWRSELHDDYRGWGQHPEVRHLAFGEFQQWQIVAAPGHPFLKAVIERVLRNLTVYVEGLHGVGAYAVLRVTGPVAYTLAIEPLLADEPHRFVDSKRGLGLVYSIFDTDASRRHETMFPHYKNLTCPLVRQTGTRGAFDLAARTARTAARGVRRASALMRRAASRVTK